MDDATRTLEEARQLFSLINEKLDGLVIRSSWGKQKKEAISRSESQRRVIEGWQQEWRHEEAARKLYAAGMSQEEAERMLWEISNIYYNFACWRRLPEIEQRKRSLRYERTRLNAFARKVQRLCGEEVVGEKLDTDTGWKAPARLVMPLHSLVRLHKTARDESIWSEAA